MQAAIAAADAVLADKNATQSDVDTAVDALAAAYKGLAKAQTSADGDGGGNGNGGSGNGNDDVGGNGGGADSDSNAGNVTGGNAGATASGAGTSTSGALSQTGDAAPVAPIVGGGLLAMLGAIISAAALRLRKRNQR